MDINPPRRAHDIEGRTRLGLRAWSAAFQAQLGSHGTQQLDSSRRRYRRRTAMARGLISVIALLPFVACSPKPPRDFAPDPGLIAQIREIKIVPQESRACPGASIHADYEA